MRQFVLVALALVFASQAAARQPQPSSLFESNVRYRLATARAEKETLAHYALGLIEPGQALLLDDATTTLALARLLPSIAPLTVITNYLRRFSCCITRLACA